MGSWYLVRHGQTQWNLQGRIQGHTDVPLAEFGRRNVRAQAKSLAGLTFSAVYASDLSRTVETAQILVNDADVSVQTDPKLREFSYGQWEGLTLEEVQARDQEDFALRFRQRDVDFAAPGGESAIQLLQRVRRFYVKAASVHDPEENLLVVTHGGSIRALTLCLLGLPDEHFWRFRVDCASLSVIRNYSSGRVLERWNITAPLCADSSNGGL